MGNGYSKAFLNSTKPIPNACSDCTNAFLKAEIALMNALHAHTDKCACRFSDPHMMNGERVRKLIQCTICADINRAQSALSEFRSADGVVIAICNCNKH